ncbi:hypothetical protein [Streptomyces sp. 6N223]|uniref:hypothetical protein n=1 Tax=Streptomyces sp. 6N223 TaxID=3457412 RepID=UPI003FD4F076
MATDLIVVDLRADGGTPTEGPEHREVQGTPSAIFRRRFTPESLVAELGGELVYRRDVLPHGAGRAPLTPPRVDGATGDMHGVPVVIR